MSDEEVLVSVRHSLGTAAVVRAALVQAGPVLWLRGMLSNGAAAGLVDSRPTLMGLGAETVVAGLLPDGADHAEVVGRDGVRRRAECGGGAWIVVLRQRRLDELPPVKFTGSDGRIISPPLPTGWRREPVVDADEPCPACDRGEWDQVWPTDESRGGSEGPNGQFVPTPIVICRVCGHEESVGVRTNFSRDDRRSVSQEEAERARQFVQKRAESLRNAFAIVDFPVYTLTGWAPQLEGWQGRSDGLVSIELVHLRGRCSREGPVTVISARNPDQGESEVELAREALALVIGVRQDWPQRSEAGLAIWLQHRDREHERMVLRAEVRSAPILLAGTPQTFSLAAADSWWTAARTSGEHTVTITARGVSPSDLQLVVLEGLSDLLANHPLMNGDTRD